MRKPFQRHNRTGSFHFPAFFTSPIGVIIKRNINRAAPFRCELPKSYMVGKNPVQFYLTKFGLAEDNALQALSLLPPKQGAFPLQ